MTWFGFPEVYYFGCWNGEAGHRLIGPHGMPLSRTAIAKEFPRCLHPERLDVDFQPGARPQGRLGFRTPEQREGDARLTHVKGWTVLSIWDRSVDHRPGSHSTFVMPGTLRFAEACTQARDAFAVVWDRFPFTIRLAEVTTID